MTGEYPQPVVLDATVLSNFASTDGVSFLFPGEEKGRLLDEHDRRVEPDESRAVSRQRFVTFHYLYRDLDSYIQYR